jgi:predicted acetyltransferase
VEGYVFYSVREVTTGHKDFALWCQDLCSLTPAATRRIAAFLADHLSMTGEFAWRGSPSEPIHAVLREQHAVTIKAWNTWMLRVLDVGAALTQRGFAPGVAGEVHLDVAEDDLVPGNAGRWILRIEGGRAEATRGGRGTFRTNVRGLAALYTGFHSPADLRAAGHADADDATVAAASALFAGPAPWMADHF